MTSPAQVSGHSPGITATTFWSTTRPSLSAGITLSQWSTTTVIIEVTRTRSIKRSLSGSLAWTFAGLRCVACPQYTRKQPRGAMSHVAPTQTDGGKDQNHDGIAEEEAQPRPRCQQ